MPATGVRHFSLAGSCLGLTFSLDFDVADKQSSVSKLKVQVPPQALAELAEFVTRIEHTQSPHTFFRGFVQYAEWNHQRGTLFRNLADTYPEIVRLPLGADCAWSVVATNEASKAGFHFIFSWRLVLDGQGRVQPQFQCTQLILDTKAKKVPDLSTKFRALLRLKGTEVAVRILTKLVASGGASLFG